MDMWEQIVLLVRGIVKSVALAFILFWIALVAFCLFSIRGG